MSPGLLGLGVQAVGFILQFFDPLFLGLQILLLGFNVLLKKCVSVFSAMLAGFFDFLFRLAAADLGELQQSVSP